MQNLVRPRVLLVALPPVALLLVALTLGCKGGGGGGTTDTASSGAAGGASTVASAKIESCGGFDVDDAAKVLGVAVADLHGSTSKMYETLRMCTYSRDGDPSASVLFSLSWEETVEEASAGMAQERATIGLAAGAIDQVTGSSSPQSASFAIPDLGDEAFYTRVNDTVVARVGNVRVQVMQPADLEKKKQVARMVVEGLR